MCVDRNFKGAFLPLLFFPDNNRYKVLHCMAKKIPQRSIQTLRDMSLCLVSSISSFRTFWKFEELCISSCQNVACQLTSLSDKEHFDRRSTLLLYFRNH